MDGVGIIPWVGDLRDVNRGARRDTRRKRGRPQHLRESPRSPRLDSFAAGSDGAGGRRPKGFQPRRSRRFAEVARPPSLSLRIFAGSAVTLFPLARAASVVGDPKVFNRGDRGDSRRRRGRPRFLRVSPRAPRLDFFLPLARTAPVVGDLKDSTAEIAEIRGGAAAGRAFSAYLRGLCG